MQSGAGSLSRLPKTPLAPAAALLAAVLATVLLPAPEAAAQGAVEAPLRSAKPASSARFGAATVAAQLGSTSPGGMDWVIVGAPYASVNAMPAAGVVEFFPPVPSLPAFQIHAPTGFIQANAHFGAALAVADIDGDGSVDLVVGAPDHDLGTGASYRADAGQVFVFFGPWAPASDPAFSGWCRLVEDPAERNKPTEPGAQFGWSVAAAPLDSATAGVVVGIPGQTFANPAAKLRRETDAGAVDVFLHLAPDGGAAPHFRDQHLTQVVTSPSTIGDRLGHAVAIGQFAYDDGLGGSSRWPDIAASAPYTDHITSTNTMLDTGAVHLFYGQDVGGVPAWGRTAAGYSVTFFAPYTAATGPSTDDQHYGWSLDAADSDGDRWTDLAVGAPSVNAALLPYVALLRGAAHGVYFKAFPPDVVKTPAHFRVANNRFGTQVCWIERSSGSILDLAVSMVTTKAGLPAQVDRVFVFEGSRFALSFWSLLEELDDRFPTAGDAEFGAALARASRSSAGLDELVVGVPGADLGGLAAAGRVEVR